jgi:hypothetical protein
MLSEQLDKNLWNASTLRDSNSLALVGACAVDLRWRQDPTIASEHLVSTVTAAPIVASLYVQSAVK